MVVEVIVVGLDVYLVVFGYLLVGDDVYVEVVGGNVVDCCCYVGYDSWGEC